MCPGCRFYCASGARTPAPTDGLSGAPCPAGHFCPRGSRSPVPCPPGSHVPHSHGEQCQPCPEGQFCVSGEEAAPCPRGELKSRSNAWFVFDSPNSADSDLLLLFQDISVPRAQLFQLLAQQDPITLHRAEPAACRVLRGETQRA